LVLYAALLLSITLTKQMISRIYAMKHFKECRIRWFWDKKKFGEMFSYAGWTYLGKTSETFAGQGVNMVMNVVFGPAVNAARGLSWTVIHSVQLFVNNFTMAIWPQVAQSYASGDHNYMKQLLFKGAKFSFFIMWLIVLPLFLETEFVVGIWLGEYPDHTINFIRLTLIANIINVLTAVLGMGIKATGKIMWNQICFSSLEFVLFCVVYVLLHNGFVPEWSYICSVIIFTIKLFVMLALCHWQLNISARDFFERVLVRVLLVTILSTIVPVIIFRSMPAGWLRFGAVLSACLFFSCLCIYFVGCKQGERKMLLSLIREKIKGV
jgi:O-antigen/teichoic acid export membrane protein